MVPFLKEIAVMLLQQDTCTLQETCIVFPNKRARLYLGRYLGELTDKPVWAPGYLTISELMETASGYQYADKLSLMFEMYKVYIGVTNSRESFDAFYPYIETLLADFDEIDKYLVDAEDLFGNLAGIKSMEGRFSYLSGEQIALIQRFWNTFDPDNVTKDQQTFLSLWEYFPLIYNELRDRLHQQGLAYEGMAYRRVAEQITDAEGFHGLNYRHYLFIGFNALNACEEKLFRALKNNGRAEFFWDYDTWYTNNDIHEAGFFVRRNLGNFPPSGSLSHDNLLAGPKQVSFIPVSSNTGQAGALQFVFNTLGISSDKDMINTALVLADENLLIPVLYALPASVNDVNVTMGYPLSGSPIANLIGSLTDLIRNSKTGPAGQTSWFYKDVLAVMGNPLLSYWYLSQYELVRQKIMDHNMVYLEEKDILQFPGNDMIFSVKLYQEDMGRYLLETVAGIMRQMAVNSEGTGSSGQVQMEILFAVYAFLTRLTDLLELHVIKPEADTLCRLINRILRGMHLPFSGEPLAGLQVLGMLETRTLDFDNVIILSANEGILPRSPDMPSFIPYSLRAGFGLPTPEHYDSIAAYYFYRLLQRAEKIALVYDCSSGGLRTGERSRFLHQIFYEMPYQVNEISPFSTISQMQVKPIVMAKNEEVAAILARYTQGNGKLLSPSAINEFLNCSLKFYFHHIADLPQHEEVTENIDARIFGNVWHKAMKYLYTTFGQTVVTREKLELLLKEEHPIDGALDKAFEDEFLGGVTVAESRRIEGYNLIIRQVIRTYMRQLISAEMESGAFSVVSLEKKYSTTVVLQVNGKQIGVQVGGVIDRIDLRQGNVVIIDYKTGSGKNAIPGVESLFNGVDQSRNDAVFQVLLYAHVYESLFPGNIVVPGLLFIRNSHSGELSYTIRQGTKKEAIASYTSVKQEFEPLLIRTLAELFNVDLPFRQTSNLKICKYCDYAAICRR